MGPGFESLKAHQWPVGQVVKTEASHAFNIGSNPVRVTSSSLPIETCEAGCSTGEENEERKKELERESALT